MPEPSWKLDPNWLSHVSWHEVAIAADALSPVEVSASLDQLAEWFPASWAENCTLRHHVAAKQLTYAGRLSLLELGHAGVTAGADDSFTARLRDPDESFGADAELRAMLLLKRSGAELERAPRGVGPRVPEFVAKWRSGSRAVIEVKALRSSDEVEFAQRLTTEVLFALEGVARELPGFIGQVKWNGDALFGTPPSVDVVKEDVALAIETVKTLARSSQAFEVALGSIGTLHLESDPSTPVLALHYDGYAPPAATIFRRIRRRCNDAIQQLAAHPTLPGLVILDIDADGLASNGLSQLYRWVATKAQLGAVFVVGREFNGRRSCGNVCVLPGPRFNEVSGALSSLERCDAGHLHFQPVSLLACPCPAGFAFV